MCFAARVRKRFSLHANLICCSRRRELKNELAGGEATEAHACPSCGARDALFVRVGGTRDIGKSETWGSKDADASGLRLSCVQCGHEWSESQQ